MNAKSCLKLKAALSLEAALVFTPVLIFLLSLVFLLYAQLLALDLRYALENVAEEISTVFPLVDSLAGEEETFARQIFEQYFTGEERGWEDSLLADYSSSLVLAPFIEARMDYYLKLKATCGSFALPEHARQVLLNWSEDGQSLRLDGYLLLPSFFGQYEQKYSALIPLWSEYLKDSQEEEEGDSSEDDNIWSADNFSRGRYFREKEGANLPLNYPVIASFKAGEAKAIKSMDLTAPSYASPLTAKKAIMVYLQKLSDFSGRSYKSSQMPSIEKTAIKSKRFVLITPKNIPKAYDFAFFSDIEQQALEMGIYFSHKSQGKSHRYKES